MGGISSPAGSSPAATWSEGRAPTTDCATPELCSVGAGDVPGAAPSSSPPLP